MGMTTVQQLLCQKGHGVFSAGPDDTVYNAIKKMADENVGSLVVMEHGKLIGIITRTPLLAQCIPERPLVTSDEGGRDYGARRGVRSSELIGGCVHGADER